MDSSRLNDPLFQMFLSETSELISQLERIVLEAEKQGEVLPFVDEIFRIMHTIKGSSAMMEITSVSHLTHSLENLFQYIRENTSNENDNAQVCELIFKTIDFVNGEIDKLNGGLEADGDNAAVIEQINAYLNKIGAKKTQKSPKNKKSTPKKTKSADPTGAEFRAVIWFDDGCGMENIRAFEVVHRIKDQFENLSYTPADIIENEETAAQIVKSGFQLRFFSNKSVDDIKALLLDTMFLKELSLEHIDAPSADTNKTKTGEKVQTASQSIQAYQQSMISVSADKLDALMDLMEELVISQSMVIQHPQVKQIDEQRLQKEIDQLEKVTNGLRDTVMSVRMVPLSVTFHKMNRLVRDMSRSLGKQIELIVKGEETEVDKNIIDKISDPLMHILRNAIDHGIEQPQERAKSGKPEQGKIELSAANVGSDVLITIKDDGRGMNREAILKKAEEKGLLAKPSSEYSDKDIYAFVFHPGFSTKAEVTEYSGRGVGMDVALKNIKKLGGSIAVDSTPGSETVVRLKIPLTIAIIDAMLISIGNKIYTIPTNYIQECFQAKTEDLMVDRYGNESIILRKECFRLLRLHRRFVAEQPLAEVEKSTVILLSYEEERLCVLVDALVDRQQIVVKALPEYIRRTKGISSCTLLGDGSVSLILDVPSLMETS